MFEWLFKYPLARFREGQLGLAHPLRIELIFLALALLAVGAWWVYRRETRLRRPWRRIGLIALRVAGVALLGLCLLGPSLSVRKREESRGILAVALDTSKSMGLGAGEGQPSRFDRARDLLVGRGRLLERIAEAGTVRLFAFGTGARPVQPADLPTLTPGDDSTQLASAMRDVAQSLRGLPLEALVLLSDGVDTSSADPVAMAAHAASRGATVHAIGFGEPPGAPDAAILDVHAPRRVQRGAAADVNVLVRRGKPTEPLELRLYQNLELLRTEVVPPAPGAETASVSLSFVPEGEGPQRFVLEIPPAPEERVVENNRRELQIEIEETRVEVLFVEGSPRHEFAFIRRAMRDSKHFKVVTLLRLGKGRYYERADDESFLSKGFPETAEALGRFKAVVLSDIEAAFFTPRQLELIADFVRVRGGGLLMLGGVNSFNLGGYQNTPLAAILPATLAPGQPGPRFDDTEFAFDLTQEGAEHEILRFTSDPQENRSQWALMPRLKGFNPLGGAKPGAQVLAIHPTAQVGGGKAILLAVQNVGAGRTAVFAPANSWRWQTLRKSGDDSFRRFWSQLLRWTAVGAKEFLAVSTDSTVVGLRQPLTLTATVLDKTHRPFNEAVVAAKVKDPFGNTDELALPWVLREDGVYQALCRPTSKGEYAVRVEADVAGAKLEAHTSFLAIETSPEFARTAMDGSALERIAQAGNGTVDLDGRGDKAAEAILAAANQRRRLLELVEERELRDAPILLLAIAGVWFAEWMLRKRSGLA